MFGIFNKKHFNKMNEMTDAVNQKNAAIMHMDAVSTAFTKVANAGFGTAGAAATVVVGTNYYASQNRLSRKDKKAMAKVNRAATATAIAGVGLGSVCTVIGAITQPLPFDPTRYIFDDSTEEKTEEQVAEAEAAVEEKIAPEATEETQEGAEQNAQ